MTVEKQDGTKVSGATVEAIFEDGRTDSAVTDATGVALIYLPDGNNKVICEYERGKGEAEISINGNSRYGTVYLQYDGFCIIDLEWTPDYPMIQDRFPELYTILSNKYPDAIWAAGMDVDQAQYGEVLVIVLDPAYNAQWMYAYASACELSVILYYDTKIINGTLYIVDAYYEVEYIGYGGSFIREYEVPGSGLPSDEFWNQYREVGDGYIAEYITLLFPGIDEYFSIHS